MKRIVFAYLMLVAGCIIARAQSPEVLDSAIVSDYRPRSDRKTGKFLLVLFLYLTFL